MAKDTESRADSGLRIAESYLTANVPEAAPNETVRAVLDRLLAGAYESTSEVAVLEGRSLVGLVRIEDLFAASDDVLISALMDSDPPSIAPGVDEEVAAWKAVERGEGSLPVVDAHGQFLGLIPSWRMLGVLLRAHDEDIARFGGFLAGAEAARGATIEPLQRRLKHRLPWLLIGLVGALLAANLVGAFEEVLAQNLALVFFIPSIVYLADAVGTQTEALLIRGLSVGIVIRRVVRQELLTGIFLGSLLGLLVFPIVLWIGGLDVATAVSLAVVGASTTATVVATLLPWVIFKAGGDPAFASGPVATVIQDILGVAVYLLIASAIL